MSEKTRMVKIGDFLTDAQIDRCSALYPDRKRIRDEVLAPNMAEIDRKLGQPNDADYLSHMVLFAIERAVERSSPVVRRDVRDFVTLSKRARSARLLEAEEFARVDVQYHLSSRLRSLNISTVELAKRLGVSETRIRRLLRSSGMNVSVRMLARIYAAIGDELRIGSREEKHWKDQSSGSAGPAAPKNMRFVERSE